MWKLHIKKRSKRTVPLLPKENIMNKKERFLASFCYFSAILNIFTVVGGVVSAVTIYFANSESIIKEHAKKAIVVQSITLFITIISHPWFILTLYPEAMNKYGLNLLIAGGLVQLVFILWNVILGYKVLNRSQANSVVS
ncbi:DUF4870 domain-containing protein [Bacillus sp. BGMRC 2118]|nr:DUF4870 domain-containing protein [Bacillus sp. BGMRC 2118]